MHAIPDAATLHRHLAEIDVFEVYNARLLFETYNDEALRFARKYNLTMGAGSDAHVLQGVGTGAATHARVRRPGGVPAQPAHGRDPAPAEVPALPAIPEVGGPGKGTSQIEAKSERAVSPVSTDEIFERYLQKAITEINELGDEIAHAAGESRFPVVGSGHPLADILLLKYGPQASEAQEGVSFYGRAGQAIIKSLQRLNVDPLAVYGTNCLKFAGQKPEQARSMLDARAAHRAAEADRRDGRRHAARSSTTLDFPLADPVEPRLGELQRFTPTIDALVVPDIDASLDEQERRRRSSGTPSRRSARGGRSCLRTERRRLAALGVVARGVSSRTSRGTRACRTSRCGGTSRSSRCS